MSGLTSDSLFETELADNIESGHIIRVAFESGVDNEFDYLADDKLWPIGVGQRVEVPFGRKNKLEVGFCVEIDIDYRETQRKKKKRFKLKRVSRVLDKEPLVDAELMELARWISSYYVCPLGQVLAAMVPSAVKKGVGVKTEKYIYLAAEQAELIKELKGKKQKHIVEFLQGRAASGAKSALEMQGVLTLVGCTEAPVKKLAQNQIIKITQKTVFRSLPAIPEGMSIKTEEVVLNEDQQKALAHIKAELDSGRFGVTLLYGVTDSGKTELYIRAIEQVLQKGKSAIVLLPEIALTAQTVQRFNDRFERIAVMHSALTAAQRNVQWQKIKAGEADVVIGARCLRRCLTWGLSLLMRSMSRAISRTRCRGIMGGTWR